MLVKKKPIPFGLQYFILCYNFNMNNQPKLRHKSHIEHGKSFSSYDPGIECTREDFQKALSKLNIIETLREISKISFEVKNSKKPFLYLDSKVLVNDYYLTLFAHELIKFGKVSKGTFCVETFLISFRMLWHLTDKEFSSTKRSKHEIELIYAYMQYLGQESTLHDITRTYSLYSRIWKKVERANNVDVENALIDICGLKISEIFAIGFAYFGQAERNGFFRKYEKHTVEKLSGDLKKVFSSEKQDAFINFFGADIKKLKKYKGELLPFVEYPIVISKQRPDPTNTEVYFVPSASNAYRRLSHGLYYDLAKKYDKGKEGNAFKTAFGYVFEEYLGILLGKHFRTWEPWPEQKYDKDKKTIDWLLVKEDKAILIEAKQIAITLESKLTGKLEHITDDFEERGLKAADQLNNTQRAIECCRHKTLEKFNNVKFFEKVIISYDPLYFAYETMEEVFTNEGREDLLVDRAHFINIAEFERLLYMQSDSESLFSLLRSKRFEQDNEVAKMDFREYTIRMFPNRREEDSFYQNEFERMVKELKFLPAP